MVPTEKIQVTVSKGWVTLQGDVEWQYQKQDASGSSPARGRQGVSNLIVVKPKLTPSELKEKIEKALVRSAETDAEQITVDVQSGKIVLKGKVRSHAEKEEAERWPGPRPASPRSKQDHGHY